MSEHPDDPDDDELMARGARGDQDAFGVLVGRWERRVFAFLVSMLGSREEAQDVAQEAFLRMCQHAPSYRASGRFRSWIFRIAGNLARSRLRRQKILGWVGFEPTAHDRPARQDGPEAPIQREEERDTVRRALQRLPARQRQAVVLRHDQGMAYLEIAETMQTTVSAVETLLHRATVSLRESLRSVRERL